MHALVVALRQLVHGVVRKEWSSSALCIKSVLMRRSSFFSSAHSSGIGKNSALGRYGRAPSTMHGVLLLKNYYAE